MLDVIDIKPYLQFIRLEYEIEDDEFLMLHPKLRRLKKYLYERRDDFFTKEVQKMIEREKNR